MKAIILHESRGRIRFRVCQKYMSFKEADILEDNDPERAVVLNIIFDVERKKASKDYTHRSRGEL